MDAQAAMTALRTGNLSGLVDSLDCDDRWTFTLTCDRATCPGKNHATQIVTLLVIGETLLMARSEMDGNRIPELTIHSTRDTLHRGDLIAMVREKLAAFAMFKGLTFSESHAGGRYVGAHRMAEQVSEPARVPDVTGIDTNGKPFVGYYLDEPPAGG